MKRRMRYGIISVLMAALTFTACSSDDDSAVDNIPGDGKAHVTLRIGVDNGSSITRSWEDNNAKTDRTEMMYSWYVVLTDASNKVVFKESSTTVADASAEIDVVASDLVLDPGTYTAYSFANIAEANLPTTITNTAVGGTLSASDVTNAVAKVSGNGFTPSATQGIPMSNKQTLTVTASDTEKDLIVVRMLAKMEIQLYNETASAVTVQSVTLSDITYNPTLSDAPANLMLLPSLSYPDDMDAHHQDITPNLNGTPATTEYTYTPASAETVEANYSYDAHKSNPGHKLTFYVNESATPTNPEGLFYLTLKLSNTEYRYALVSDNNSHEWNYIARNDYRIIPIVIDDYKLELIPYDFPPIGVYPASVKEIEDDLYEMTFHDYGHFHLLPCVTKGATAIPFGNPDTSGEYWSLIGNSYNATNWASSWKTAEEKGDAWLTDEQIAAFGFYRIGDGSTTADGDDEGQIPVWYANDGSKGPQWDPNLAAGITPNYQPFIFGYINDPGAEWWGQDPSNRTEKKLYHELRVELHNAGVHNRVLYYRFYMKLSADQMLGARRPASMPRKRH